jgi:hypothetical protein
MTTDKSPQFRSVEEFLAFHQHAVPRTERSLAERERGFHSGPETAADAVLVYGTEYLSLDGGALIGRTWEGWRDRYTWSFALTRSDGHVDRVIRWGAASEKEARALLAAYRGGRVLFALVAENTSEEYDWDPWAPGRAPHDLWLSILAGDLYPDIGQALGATLDAAEAQGRPISEVPVVVPDDLAVRLGGQPPVSPAT